MVDDRWWSNDRDSARVKLASDKIVGFFGSDPDEDTHNVDNEVVLGDADFGRCHSGRQLRRVEVHELQMPWAEFAGRDRS